MKLALDAVYLFSTPVDGRLGIEGLSQCVQRLLGTSPCDGRAFVFCNRAGTRIKLLAWDGNGVWLATRRLHRGRFVWPAPGATHWQLDATQWQWLIAGVDWQRHTPAIPANWTV